MNAMIYTVAAAKHVKGLKDLHWTRRQRVAVEGTATCGRDGLIRVHVRAGTALFRVVLDDAANVVDCMSW